MCTHRFLAEFGSVRHGVAWPGLSRLGSSSAQLSLARHAPAQCDSQLVLAWLGLAQSASASAGKGTLGPGPVVVDLYFASEYLIIHAKARHKIRLCPIGLRLGINVRLDSTRLSSAEQCPAKVNPAPLRSAWLHLGLPVQLPARLSSAQLGSARHNSK